MELQNVLKPSENPFKALKARSLLIWGLLSIPVFVLMHSLIIRVAYLSNINPKDAIFELIISLVWGYGLFVSWTWWQLTRFRISFRRIIGTLPRYYRWLPTIGLVICVLLFSAGSFYLVYYFVSFIAPGYVKWVLSIKYFLPGSKTSLPILYNALSVITLVVVAPVTEEILFRGILLHRWTVKWGIGPALLTSSLVFAVLHGNIIGLFNFGLVMALLYVKTRTLIVPIACHALNNAMATVLGLLAMSQSSTATVYTLEKFRSQVWIGVLLTALSAPWIIRFIYKNWPKQSWQAPYFISGTGDN